MRFPSLRRSLKFLLIGCAGLLVAAAAGIAVFIATFDANGYKPRIEAAVKQATGRDLALNGPLRLKFALRPTIEAEDVAFANIEDGSRPRMATIQSLEVRFALLPLLDNRLEIDRLVLRRPDILLETSAQGRPNWRFAPDVPSQNLPQSQPQPSDASPRPPPVLSVREVRIEDGQVAYRNGRTGAATTITVRAFAAKAESADAPLVFSGEATKAGVPFTLAGEVGSLASLQDTSRAEPWPVRLVLAAAGAQVSAVGAVARPLEARGYALQIDGSVPDLLALGSLAPNLALPPLRDLRFGSKIADSGGPVPAVSALTLHIGPSDLTALAAGLRLASLDVSAPGLDQPVHVEAAGSFVNAPLALVANLGAPAALLPSSTAPAGPFPVDMTVQAVGAVLTVKGSIARPQQWAGANLAVSGTIPDLAALSPLARRPLPALKAISFQGLLADQDGGFAKGIVLRDTKLAMPEAEIEGYGSYAFGPPRPTIQATLAAKRIDADGLQAAFAATPATSPSPAASPAPAASGDVPNARPSQPPGRERLIPDTPLPREALRAADADLHMTAAELVSGGASYRDLDGRLRLQDGRLSLDPFSAVLPGGRMTLKLTADANPQAPQVAVNARAPGLADKPLLALLQLPGDAAGNLEVDLALNGQGGTLRAIAASMSGHVGLAMVDGRIDNRLLGSVLGEALRRSNLPDTAVGGGLTDLRCFAFRMDAQAGIGEVRALLLDTALLHLEGGGTLNFRDETVALRLRPLARLGGTGVSLPLRVSGTFLDPKAAIDPSAAAGEAARLAQGAAAGRSAPLGIIIGALGGDRMIAGSGQESCGSELGLARGGQAGPAPAAAAGSRASQPRSGERPRAPGLDDLLRLIPR